MGQSPGEMGCGLGLALGLKKIRLKVKKDSSRISFRASQVSKQNKLQSRISFRASQDSKQDKL